MSRPAPVQRILAGQPAVDGRPRYAGPPILALGFRPFYLLAAAFAALGMALWAGSLLSLIHI